MNPSMLETSLGIVVIGRNEGERLVRCLASARRNTPFVVYVDSGSHDGSVEFAKACDVKVVELDLSLPFTAARARNMGFRALLERWPQLAHVQFVDGDCELIKGWPKAAAQFLNRHPDVAVVCGRRRERYPERSVYNLLADREWDTPVGETRACGGDALMRVDAFVQACGFREDLIAGEEPELCVRLRRAGWRIWRIGLDMVWHDAAMTRFGQWWRRSVRAGHAFAEGAALHGGGPERHFVPELQRATIWGLVLPTVILVTAFAKPPAGISLALIYPLQYLRLGLRDWRGCTQGPWFGAAFLVLGKFAEASGAMRYWVGRWTDRRSALIEYK